MFRGVMMQASETSTTAVHPVREIAELTRSTETLLIVDGITGIGVYDLPMGSLGCRRHGHRLAKGNDGCRRDWPSSL